MKKVNNYWTQVEEDIIKEYLQNPLSKESEENFRTIIYPALKTLIQNIMYRYQLFDSIRPIDEQIDDTLSFVVEKFFRFDPSRKTKAFSYYGTVAKRYMMANKIKNKHNKSVEIEDLDGYEIENNICDNNYYIKEQYSLDKFMELLYDNIDNHFKENLDYNKNVYIVSDTILCFLKNYTDINLINKNYFYFLCRERTGLKTKDITKGINIIKKIYDQTLEEFR